MSNKSYVTTCTLNPAIDRFAFCGNFATNTVNSVNTFQDIIGGKGINVAIVLASLGVKTTACGLIGAENSEIFESTFKRLGVKNSLQKVEGSTRVNVKIEAENGETTDINFPSLNLTQQNLESVATSIKQEASKYIVIGGSLPKCLSEDTYLNMLNKLKQADNKIILDTSKNPLKLSLNANVYAIKPNIEELEEICGKKLETTESIISSALNIVKQGVENVIVSLGEKGALFVNKDSIFTIKTSKQNVVNTVGAGDTLVAGLTAQLCKGSDFVTAAKFAVALSAFSVTKRGIEFDAKNNMQDINNILDGLEFKNY